MLNGNYDNDINSRSTTNINEDDEDEDNENDNDEDNTAKLDRRRSLKSPSENRLALQRVKSLTERNRMVSNIKQFCFIFVLIFFLYSLTTLDPPTRVVCFDSDIDIFLYPLFLGLAWMRKFAWLLWPTPRG